MTGIGSIIDMSMYISELHIVKHGYKDREEIYKGWLDDKKDLDRKNIRVIWHSKFDPKKVRTTAIVYVQPDMQICDGAIRTLHEDMVAAAADRSTQTHFAVSSVTAIFLDKAYRWSPMCWLHALTYGFLLVIMTMDWMRSIFNLYKYQRATDLRGRTVFQTFPQRAELAPDRWITA